MKYLRPFAVLFAVLASLSLAVAAEVLPEKPVKLDGDASSTPTALAWLKDVETYKRIVTDLAAPGMEGRGPGTQGIDKARDYLVNEFKLLGLTPAFRDGKGEASFLQEFVIPAGVHLKEQELVILGKDGKAALSPKSGEHYGTRGFSGDGAATASLVFVGYGAVVPDKKYDSYAGLAKDELKGKIAVAYRFEPVDEDGVPWLMTNGRKGATGPASSLINKAKWAAEHGAAALLVVDPPSRDKEGAIPSVAQTQGEPASIPVIQIAPEVFRFMLREAGLGDESTARQWEKDGNDNHTKIKHLDPLKATVKVKMERKQATIHNVAGVLPGAGSLKDEYIVIGGHYDHLGLGDRGSLSRTGKEEVHHGADDNASGTAGVVLTAMRFAQHAKAKDAPENRRSILFVLFSGEEKGLLGSAHMLRKPEELGIKLEQMVLMLNMDMTGRMVNNKLFALGTGSGDRLEKMSAVAAKELNIQLATDSGGPSVGGSDHMSFHMKSIPAIHFFTGVHVDYHKPSDTADKINSEGGTKTVDLVCKITQQVWGSNEKIAFQKVRIAHAASGGPRGGGAFLGVIPDYASTEAGATLSGTSAGSPAEAAGLKEGDRIIAWNGKPVKNVEEFSAFLFGNSKPGDEITMKVIRAKKEIEIKVKLGTR